MHKRWCSFFECSPRYFLCCSYTKVVAKGMKKAEMILKVINFLRVFLCHVFCWRLKHPNSAKLQDIFARSTRTDSEGKTTAKNHLSTNLEIIKHLRDIQKCPYYLGVRIKPAQKKNVMDNGITVSTVSLNYKTTFCHAIEHAKMSYFEYQCTLKLHLVFASW